MKTIFNWSGGKDSALALYHALQNPQYDIQTLLTTVNKEYERISMHGVRQALLDAQAKEIGTSLHKVMVPKQPSMEVYNNLMASNLKQLQKQGFEHSIFGDIFLEDLREYRTAKLKDVGFSASFPLWKRNTKELLHEFLRLGFKTFFGS